MSKPVLYLMLGYPGGGKTTVSRELAAQTGAVHLWADHERRNMFNQPTHSKEESDKLYEQLNQQAEELLKAGKSVVFDTSFNHFADREYLRTVAKRHNAKAVLLHLDTPRDIAKARATHVSHAEHNNYTHTMSSEDFERIANHLELPYPEEHAIKVDGTNFNINTLQSLLK